MHRSTSWTCRSDFGWRSWPLHRSALRLAGVWLLATASALTATSAAQETRGAIGTRSASLCATADYSAEIPRRSPPPVTFGGRGRRPPDRDHQPTPDDQPRGRRPAFPRLPRPPRSPDPRRPPRHRPLPNRPQPSNSANSSSNDSSSSKSLKKLLCRLKKLHAPDASPEQQATEANAELVRLQALLAQAEKNPDVLLPPPFRATGPGGKPSVNAEMKDALEAATAELKERKAKLDSLRTEVVNWEGQQNARRAERDKLFQVVAAMKAQGAEREEPAGTATASTASRRLARERQVNAGWKSRVEGLRLQAIEAQIALEAKLAGVRELGMQVCHAQVKVAEKTLELMQSRYTYARRTAGTHPQGKGGRRGEQVAAVAGSAGAVPCPSTGGAAGSRGAGRQARAGAGHLAAAVAGRAAEPGRPRRGRLRPDQGAARRRTGQPPRRHPAQQRLPPDRTRARPAAPQRDGHRRGAVPVLRGR